MTVQDNRIRLYRLDGSVEREIVVSAARYLATVTWASDGAGFYCGNNLGGPQYETLRVEFDGSSRVIWKDSGVWATPSRDGKQLALMGLVRDSNVWLLRSK